MVSGINESQTELNHVGSESGMAENSFDWGSAIKTTTVITQTRG